MATPPIPEDCRGLIPHLVVNDAKAAIDFYARAFGATERMRMPMEGDDRLMHAQIEIDGAVMFLADDFPEFCAGEKRDAKSIGATPVAIHRYVEDCDAAVKRAEEAGATVVMPPQDMFWGDRFAKIVDPFGHEWTLATQTRTMTPAEMREAAKNAFSG